MAITVYRDSQTHSALGVNYTVAFDNPRPDLDALPNWSQISPTLDAAAVAAVAKLNAERAPLAAQAALVAAAEQASAGRVFNVRAFLAVGDGVTDDTDAIQATIDAAYATGGGTVYFPASRAPYRHTGLTVYSGVTLAGDGMNVNGGGGTELRMLGDTAPAVYGINVRFVSIRDMCLTGTVPGTTLGSWDGVLLEQSDTIATASISMSNVLLVGFSRHGVYVEDMITSTFANVRAQNCGGYGFFLNIGTSNTFTSCYANGCHSGGFKPASMSYSAFIGCAVDSTAGPSYDVVGGSDNAFIACGMEDGAPGTTGFKFTGGASHSAISCYSNGHGGIGLHVTGAAEGIIIQGFREVNPPVGATASIKVDAGCTAVALAWRVSTAVAFAPGTTKQWASATLYHTHVSTVAFNLDRQLNTNFANVIYSTAGVDKWAFGTRNDATDDLHLRNPFRETAAMVVEDRATAPNMSLLTSAKNYGGGIGVLHLPNAALAPSTNPASGGVLYIEGGALKWRGSGGTVTTIAPA